MPRDILKTLRAEHELLRELFKKLNATTDRAAKSRAALLEEIESNLLAHAKWEETVFYPAFAERADRDGLQTYAEAKEEHKAVENTVLPDVKAADPGSTEFAGRSRVLGEFVEHHAREEESTLFKAARELFSSEERAQLDEDYEGWKASPEAMAATAGSAPKTPSRPNAQAVQ
jgi:hypothetical protein